MLKIGLEKSHHEAERGNEINVGKWKQGKKFPIKWKSVGEQVGACCRHHPPCVPDTSLPDIAASLVPAAHPLCPPSRALCRRLIPCGQNRPLCAVDTDLPTVVGGLCVADTFPPAAGS